MTTHLKNQGLGGSPAGAGAGAAPRSRVLSQNSYRQIARLALTTFLMSDTPGATAYHPLGCGTSLLKISHQLSVFSCPLQPRAGAPTSGGDFPKGLVGAAKAVTSGERRNKIQANWNVMIFVKAVGTCPGKVGRTAVLSFTSCPADLFRRFGSGSKLLGDIADAKKRPPSPARRTARITARLKSRLDKSRRNIFFLRRSPRG